MSSPDSDHIEQDQDGPDRDRRIRHVKRPEVGAAPVHIHEIDDVTGDCPIDEVAERATEDERQPEARHPLVEPKLRRVGSDGNQRDGRDCNHHDRFVREICRVQQPECGAGVVHVRQIQEFGDDAAAFAKREHYPDDRFRHLIEREARILDNLLFEDWLKLFAPECAYWVPSTPERGDPRREIAVMFDDRRRLEDRVYRLRTGYAWSQAPSSRTSRLVANVEVFRGKSAEQRMVRSNFIISEFWDNEIRTLCGWAGHRFRKANGDWLISAKQVNLLNCDQCIRNPSIIL